MTDLFGRLLINHRPLMETKAAEERRPQLHRDEQISNEVNGFTPMRAELRSVEFNAVKRPVITLPAEKWICLGAR